MFETTSKISVIVPTVGRLSVLRLLRSIQQASTSAARGTIEVIVVLDPKASTFVTPESGEFPIRVLTAEKSGVNRARNRGAAEARGQVLAFLDDDVELKDTRFFQSVSAIFDRTGPTAVIAAGGDYISAPDSTRSARSYNLMCSIWRGSSGVAPKESLLGGCLCVRKSAWSKVGGFDERIEYGGAETSFVQKLHKLDEAAGTVEFSPELSVVHRPENRSQWQWLSIAFRQGLRKTETYRSLPGRSQRFFYLRKRWIKLSLDQKAQFVVFAFPFWLASLAGFTVGCVQNRCARYAGRSRSL